MPPVRSRREVLRSLASVGCIALAGCSQSLQQAPPGTLVIRNEDDRAHTVSIFVTTTASERPQAETLYCTEDSTTPPAPHSGTSWQYELRFDVGEDETVREDEFFPYAGHTVEVDLDDTDCDTRLGYEYDYTPSNGFVLLVNIDEAGNVHVDSSGNLPV